MTSHNTFISPHIRRLLKAAHKTRLGDVKWAYAANTMASLRTAITDPAIDILEVDVSLTDDGEPIAAHPPQTMSDLTIFELMEILRGTGKGIKFDFKTFEAVGPVIELLLSRPLSQTVILNADVLAASGAEKPSIEAVDFIRVCKPYTDGILSLGWTTNANPHCIYTNEGVNEMLEVCSNLGHVTFPVRASMLPQSWSSVRLLLSRPDSSLTIWDSNPIDRQLQEWLRQNTDPENCFYEVAF